MSVVKRMLKVLAILVGLVVVVIAGLAIYVSTQWDKTWEAPGPIEKISVSTDSAVIAQGKYLVFGPAHCVECHTLNFQEALKDTTFSTPLDGGLRLQLGPLGALYSANLTSDHETGIGKYSDELIVRTLRYAIKPNGRATIGPMMPFGNMAEDDLTAVLSFLRTQPPVHHEVPEPEWTTLGKVVRTFVSIAQPRTSINPPKTAPHGETIERGEYLTRYVANCVGCHTPRDAETFEPIGPDFSGGMELDPMPFEGVDMDMWFRSPNLTPAKGSALMKFPDRETFIGRFRLGGRQYEGSPMPWEAFAKMTDEDFGAIYKFLHSLQPVEKPEIEEIFEKTAE